MAENNPKLKPVKRHHPVRNTIIILLVVLILPVLVLYILIFDTSFKKFVGDDSLAIADVILREANNGLDDTKDTGMISVALTQDDLNEMLYLASKSTASTASTTFATSDSSASTASSSSTSTATASTAKKSLVTLQGVKVTINSDSYTFEVGATMPMLTTKATLITKLSETDTAFVFTITNIKLGHLGGLDTLASSVASNFVSDSSLNSSFASAGLHMQATLKEKKITYDKATLMDDIQAMALKGSSEKASLPLAAVKDFLTGGLLKLSFYDDQALKANIDLSPLATNPTYVTDDKRLNLDFSSYRDKLVSLLDNGIIDSQDSHDRDTFAYLLIGYPNSGDEIKQYIADKDFSSIGITNKETYLGLNLTTTNNVGNLIASGLAGLSAGSANITLTEDFTNDIFKTLGIIGNNFVLTSKKTATTYKSNYIAVDNFFVNFLDDKLYLTAGLSINGYETSFAIPATKKEKTQYGMILDITDAYYGTHFLSGGLKDVLYPLVEDALGSTGWMSMDSEKKEFVIDFANYFKANPLIQSVDVSLKGSSLADEGAIAITANFGL
jgi:hypothetical protein